MKKFLFSLILLLVSYVGFSQKGLSYQAVILDPNKIEVPGQDITGQPLVNGDVWVKFSIFNGSSLQFEEVQKTKTDNYGLINLMIGSVSTASFNSLVWDSSQKTLQVHVSFDQGSSYTKVSDQKLTYSPYTLFAETAGKLGGVLGIAGGGTGATTAADARSNLGLDQVNNTSDAVKPISTATRAALDLKANVSEMAASLGAKADTANVKTALALKANTADVTTALALKANSTDVTTALALKANSANVNLSLAAKADTAYILTKVAAATIADADASTKGKIQLAGDLAGTAAAPTVPGLALKANSTDVTAALALKANSSDVTTALAAKADTAYVLTKVAAATIADADASTKGKIQLAGDLAGTAAVPTVPGLALKANVTDLSSLTTTVNSNTASITANTSNIALKANTTDVATALELKAPLASPALSGVPTAPTASTGTNTTQIATTEYTNAAISSALSSTLFSVSTTLTSTINNPLGFYPSDNTNLNGPLNVSTAQNLANGVDVLKVNQSGIANVGFGIANLYSNTTGNANTSVGYKGLYSNTSGIGNSAYGTYSLFNNTTGTSNTANGAQALFSNTTGGRNTASGKWALFSNSIESDNTANGYLALYANTGGGNTAMGANAMQFNTIGFNNAAIGYYALSYLTRGASNTAIGFNAMGAISEGSGITGLGSGTDATNGITNGTAVGYNARVTASNTIQLGNSSVTNVNTSGSITAGAGTSSFAGPVVVGGTTPLVVGGTTATGTSAALEVKSITQGFLLPRLTTAQRDAISNPEPGLLIYNSEAKKFQGFSPIPSVGNDGDPDGGETVITSFDYINPQFKSQGQTFTLATSMVLNSIILDITYMANNPTIMVEIYSYSRSSGSITSTGLDAGVKIGFIVKEVTTQRSNTFTFNSPLNLAVGSYYFKVSGPPPLSYGTLLYKNSAYGSESAFQTVQSFYGGANTYTTNSNKSFKFILNGGNWSDLN